MRTPPRLSEYVHFPVVAGLAVLAIAVTVARWAGTDVSPLLNTAMIRRGEVWRLLTCILPHGDILHLAFNVYWLWVFGAIVEEAFGHLKTALLILVLAVGASAFEFAFLQGGIGLSGVGYGLFGFLWVLSDHDPRFRDAVDKSTIQLFVIWFFFCILTTYFGWLVVANVAHAAGLALGALIGFSVSPLRSRPRLAAAAAGALFFGGLVLATYARPFVNLSRFGGYEEAQWGYNALNENRYQEGERWFRDAVRYQPRQPEFWFDLAIAESRLGKSAEAHAAFQRAHELDPSNPDYAEAAGMTK